MKLKVINLTGTQSSQTQTLPAAIFAAQIHPDVLSQYLRVYLSRQRQATAKAQSRSEVTGTTAKVWRQKGTGRARHGSRKAPIFVGGGQAHGPSGNQNYQLRLSKKLRRQALLAALTAKAGQIQIISDLNQSTLTTKKLLQALTQKLNWDQASLTFVIDTTPHPLINAARNLKSVSTTQVHRLNPYEILNTQHLVFTQSALAKLLSQVDESSATPQT